MVLLRYVVAGLVRCDLSRFSKSGQGKSGHGAAGEVRCVEFCCGKFSRVMVRQARCGISWSVKPRLG